MLRPDLSRRRTLGIASALALHVLLLAGLVMALRPKPPPAEPPVINVSLLRLPRPARVETPVQGAPQQGAAVPTRAPTAARPGAEGPPASADQAGDPFALMRAPFADHVWPRRRTALQACLDEPPERAAADGCQDVLLRLPPAPRDPGGELAREASRKQAFHDYRDTIGGPFPGLHCVFDPDCDPPPAPRP